MAYEIIKRLKKNNQTQILELLQSAVTDKEKKKGQLHKVFEESFDAKSIDNRKFFLQKLNYIITDIPETRLCKFNLHTFCCQLKAA